MPSWRDGDGGRVEGIVNLNVDSADADGGRDDAITDRERESVCDGDSSDTRDGRWDVDNDSDAGRADSKVDSDGGAAVVADDLDDFGVVSGVSLVLLAGVVDDVTIAVAIVVWR